MKRSEKESVVAHLSEGLKRAKAVVVAEYRGLKVSEITEIRREIRKGEGEFRVVKNRLMRRALAGSVWQPLEGYLRGPTAVALSGKDPVVLSKVLFKYAESFAALKLKMGSIEGRLVDAKGLETLAKLPSLEELYARFLGTLLAPAGRLVRVLQGVPQKLAIALKGIAEKKQ